MEQEAIQRLRSEPQMRLAFHQQSGGTDRQQDVRMWDDSMKIFERIFCWDCSPAAAIIRCNFVRYT
jgi:hypothetical protein